MKPLLAEAGTGGGTAFERDAAAVLRRVETAVNDNRGSEPGNRRAFLDLLGRLVRKSDDVPPAAEADAAAPPRLIVP